MTFSIHEIEAAVVVSLTLAALTAGIGGYEFGWRDERILQGALDVARAALSAAPAPQPETEASK
jgi:hypothetical protein